MRPMRAFSDAIDTFSTSHFRASVSINVALTDLTKALRRRFLLSNPPPFPPPSQNASRANLISRTTTCKRKNHRHIAKGSTQVLFRLTKEGSNKIDLLKKKCKRVLVARSPRSCEMRGSQKKKMPLERINASLFLFEEGGFDQN